MLSSTPNNPVFTENLSQSGQFQLPKTMQAIAVTDLGPQSQLQFVEMAVPTPAPSQVLVQVFATGVNRADLAQRAGVYPPPPGESEILGLEVAGIVVGCGSALGEAWLGKAVFGLVPGGGYAEYAVLEVAHLIEKPESWSFVEAAASAEVFLTAYQALFTIGDLAKGSAALIHAGASGVGTAAIQLAKAAGAQVAVTVGSADKVHSCLQLGADVAVDYKTSDFVSLLQAKQPQGFAVIVDPVAGDYIAKDLQLLALDGKIVVLAMMGGRKIPELDLAVMFKKRGQLICSTLRNRSNHYKAELVKGLVSKFYSQWQARTIMPTIGFVASWQQAQEAHQLMASNQLIGKAVLVVRS